MTCVVLAVRSVLGTDDNNSFTNGYIGYPDAWISWDVLVGYGKKRIRSALIKFWNRAWKGEVGTSIIFWCFFKKSVSVMGRSGHRCELITGTLIISSWYERFRWAGEIRDREKFWCPLIRALLITTSNHCIFRLTSIFELRQGCEHYAGIDQNLRYSSLC